MQARFTKRFSNQKKKKTKVSGLLGFRENHLKVNDKILSNFIEYKKSSLLYFFFSKLTFRFMDQDQFHLRPNFKNQEVCVFELVLQLSTVW